MRGDTEDLVARLNRIRIEVGECLKDVGAGQDARRYRGRPPAAQTGASDRLDFTKGVRSFVKRYGKGLSGPRKFVVLLARMSNGDVANQVAVSDIQAQWNKMTGLLGKFNHKFSLVARENDWVETKKPGLYNLRPSWQDAVRGGS